MPVVDTIGLSGIMCNGFSRVLLSACFPAAPPSPQLPAASRRSSRRAARCDGVLRYKNRLVPKSAAVHHGTSHGDVSALGIRAYSCRCVTYKHIIIYIISAHSLCLSTGYTRGERLGIMRVAI